jgi:hypothetical protein
MRTRTAVPPGQAAAARAAWASAAALSAAPAAGKATKQASPSVPNSTPPWCRTAWRRMARWARSTVP